MDPNLMSCPTCGHSVSNASGACTYCGAMMTVDQQQLNEGKETSEPAQAAESPAPSTQPEPPVPGAASVDADHTQPGPIEQSDALTPQQLAELTAAAPTPEADTQAVTGLAENQASPEKEVEAAATETEPVLEAEAEIIPLARDDASDSRAAMAETSEPQSVPPDDGATIEQGVSEDPVPQSEPAAAPVRATITDVVETAVESAAADSRLPPEPKPVDLSIDETGDTEIAGETIGELTQVQNLQDEVEIQLSAESAEPLQTSAEPVDTDSDQLPQPKSDAGFPFDAKAGLITESLGDTILLDVTDEVLPAGDLAADQAEAPVKLQPAAELLQVDKAAREMAAALKKQRAALAEAENKPKPDTAAIKAQALKKQQAALAKARAVKKQKMILAKAAALKRKKAALAKAQALKKQEAARNAVETAKNEEVAAAVVKPNRAQVPETASKMQTLLQKYKGRAVGINYDNSADIREAHLVEANAEYFSVFVKDKELHYTYPLKTILTVIEGKNGVEAGESGQKSKFTAVIKVYPLVLF